MARVRRGLSAREDRYTPRMAPPPAAGRPSPVPEDLRLQRAEWRFERAGALVLLALVAAAALGLFGNGLLSRAVRVDGPLEVVHQRFARSGAAAPLDVTVAPGAAVAGTVDVLVAEEYLGAVDVQSVSPEPDSTSVAPGFLVLTFPVEPDAELRVRFSVQAEDVGTVRGTVRAGGASVSFAQFVYP